MWAQDMKEMYKDDPASVNIILTALTLFGANTRTVDQSKSQGNTIKEPRVQADYERTKDDGFVPPKITTTIEYRGENIEMTEKQKETFKEDVLAERDRLYNEYFEKHGNEYDRMPDVQRKNKISAIHSEARERITRKFKEGNKNMLNDIDEKVKKEKQEAEKQAIERRN